MSSQVIHVPPITWSGRLTACQAATYARMLADLAKKHRAEALSAPAEAGELCRIAETDEMLAEGFLSVVGPLRLRETRRIISAGGRAA